MKNSRKRLNCKTTSSPRRSPSRWNHEVFHVPSGLSSARMGHDVGKKYKLDGECVSMEDGVCFNESSMESRGGERTKKKPPGEGGTYGLSPREQTNVKTSCVGRKVPPPPPLPHCFPLHLAPCLHNGCTLFVSAATSRSRFCCMVRFSFCFRLLLFFSLTLVVNMYVSFISRCSASAVPRTTSSTSTVRSRVELATACALLSRTRPAGVNSPLR